MMGNSLFGTKSGLLLFSRGTGPGAGTAKVLIRPATAAACFKVLPLLIRLDANGECIVSVPNINNNCNIYRFRTLQS